MRCATARRCEQRSRAQPATAAKAWPCRAGPLEARPRYRPPAKLAAYCGRKKSTSRPADSTPADDSFPVERTSGHVQRDDGFPLVVVAWWGALLGVITEPTSHRAVASSLSSCRSRPWCRWVSSPSPWALLASAWAGFITHSRARCEIGSVAPARLAPDSPATVRHSTPACTGDGDPPPPPPLPLVRQLATVAPAAALPYPPRVISKSLHTPSHPPALPTAPALEVGQARVRAAAEEETAAVGGGSGAEGSGGPGCGGSLTPLLPFPGRELTYDPVCCAQRNRPLTDRWKEALYDRDRMIKAHYGSGTA